MKAPTALLVKIGVLMLVITVVLNVLTALSEIPFIGVPVVLVVTGVALFVAFHVLKKKVKRSLRKVVSIFN
jgi:uncharacterized membrane protein